MASRFRKFLRWTAAGTVALAVAGVALYRCALPAYAEAAIRRALAERGLPDARFELRDVSLDRLRLDDVSLDATDRLTIRSVEVEYSLGELRDGRVSTVRVDGLRWVVRARDGAVDLGPIEDVAPGPPAERWPFDRVELRDAELAVERGARRWRVPVEAWVADAGRQRLRLGLGAVVAGESVRADGELRLGGSLDVEVTARVAERGLFEARIRSGKGRWSAAVSGSGRSDALELDVRGHRVVARDVALWVGEAAVADDRIAALDARLTVEQLAVDGRVAEDVELRAVRAGERVHVRAAGRGERWRLDELAAELPVALSQWRAELPVPVWFELGRLQVGGLGPIDLRGRGVARLGPDPQLAVAEARAALPRVVRPVRIGGVVARGVSAELLLAGTVGAERVELELLDGSTLRAAELRHGKWPAARRVRARLGGARVGFARGRLDGYRVPVRARGAIGRGELAVSGAVRGRDDRWRADVRLRAPRFALRPGDELHRALVDAIGVAVRGDVELDAALRASPGRADGTARIALTGGELASRDGRRRVTGVDAVLTLGSFAPPATGGLQRISWTGARVGDFALGAGAIHFDLESPRSLYVAGARVRLGGGRIVLAPVRLDPRAPDAKLTLRVERVDLKSWLARATGGKLAGAGRLSGHVSFRLRTEPRLRIDIGDSALAADGRGWIRIRDRALIERSLAIGAGASYGGQVADRIVGSLEDFGYRSLRLEVVGAGRSQALRIHTAGAGRRIRQDLDLTVNVNGFQQLVGPALRAWLAKGGGS